jgi:hypothetical protein
MHNAALDESFDSPTPNVTRRSHRGPDCAGPNRATARLAGCLAAAITLGFGVATTEAAVIGGSGYRAFSDSPFATLDFSGANGYFYLETFEDQSLDTPGVTVTQGLGITSTLGGFSAASVDSVDADDGLVDGRCRDASGSYCDGYYGGGFPGVGFEFSEEVLGSLPTHVGIVWVDGTNPVAFEARNASGQLLGSFGPAFSAGPAFDDQDVLEDIFVGAVFDEGIKSILVTSGSGGIEVDHLQYGFGVVVPAPGGFVLTLTAIASAFGASWRRRTRSTPGKPASPTRAA